MKYQGSNISLQEVPGEISLVFLISECPHRCPGCHSPELWTKSGTNLSTKRLLEEIKPYAGLITCVCFFGGEWEEGHLITCLKMIQAEGYKTCLYSGAETVSEDIQQHLNYLKIGPWKKELGGLDSIKSNQQFINLDDGRYLNYLFQHTSREIAHA